MGDAIKNITKISPDYLYDRYYYYLTAIYFSAMFIAAIRVGFTSSIVLCVLIYQMAKEKKIVLSNGQDIFVMSYIVFNLSSIFWFLLSDLPANVFFEELSNSLLPVFFYFVAANRKITMGSLSDFYDNTLNALVICFVIGFILFFWLPDFYLDYIAKLQGFYEDSERMGIFYQSIFGVTATGSLGAIGLLICCRNISLHRKIQYKWLLYFVICLFSMALTYRRGPIVSGIFGMLFIGYIAFFKFKRSKFRKIIYLFSLVFIILIALYFSPQDSILHLLFDRVLLLPEAFYERKDTWFDGIDYIQNIITGDGLGVYGHKAVPYSSKVITDGNYFKMFGEIGLVGLLLYVAIILKALKIGFSNLQKFYLPVAIILVVSMQAIGSNVLAFQLVAPIFWYSIGLLRVNNK